jgi:hypothetical protein
MGFATESLIAMRRCCARWGICQSSERENEFQASRGMYIRLGRGSGMEIRGRTSQLGRNIA